MDAGDGHAMKIITSCNLPFALAHGGVQNLIEAVTRALVVLGVEVEPERWWDERQTGDVLHYFGRPPLVQHVRFAQQKGRRVVMFESLDQTASRSRLALFGQRVLTRLARTALPAEQVGCPLQAKAQFAAGIMTCAAMGVDLLVDGGVRFDLGPEAGAASAVGGEGLVDAFAGGAGVKVIDQGAIHEGVERSIVQGKPPALAGSFRGVAQSGGTAAFQWSGGEVSAVEAAAGESTGGGHAKGGEQRFSEALRTPPTA